VGLEAQPGGVGQATQLDQLVGGQRLGGEQVQGACAGVGGHGTEDGQVVAERLARRRRRDDDEVAPCGGGLVRRGLVRVRRLDATAAQRVDEAGIDTRGPWRVARRPSLDHAVGRDQRRELGARQQGGDRLVGAAGRGGQHRLLLLGRRLK
jgi:hypothetical protein